MTEAETAELRERLDKALLPLREPPRGDKSDQWPVDELSDVVTVLCSAEISTPEQISILYDALDYLSEDRGSEECQLEERERENYLYSSQRALLALGRYVMAQRRAAKAAHTDPKRQLDS